MRAIAALPSSTDMYVWVVVDVCMCGNVLEGADSEENKGDASFKQVLLLLKRKRKQSKVGPGEHVVLLLLKRKRKQSKVGPGEHSVLLLLFCCC